MHSSIKDGNVFKDMTKSLLVGAMVPLLTSFSYSNFKNIEIKNFEMKQYVSTQFNNYNGVLDNNEGLSINSSFITMSHKNEHDDFEQINYYPKHEEFEIDLEIVEWVDYKPSFGLEDVYEEI